MLVVFLLVVASLSSAKVGYVGFLENLFPGNSDNQKQVIVVGTASGYPPFEYDRGGIIIGYDIDVLYAIADKLDVTISVKDIPFNKLIPALEHKEIDWAISGITVTPDRKQLVDFTDSYYHTFMTVLSRKDDAIKTIEDLRGQTLGVAHGSIWENIARNSTKKMSMKVVALSSVPDLIGKLFNGDIDGVIMEERQAKYFCKTHNELIYSVLTDWGMDKWAIALPPNSPWREKINNVLDRMKKNGSLTTIEEKWSQD
jgi:polar amino acid transport system substrate-binding protein